MYDILAKRIAIAFSCVAALQTLVICYSIGKLTSCVGGCFCGALMIGVISMELFDFQVWLIFAAVLATVLGLTLRCPRSIYLLTTS
jgi:hypothetical protein